MVTGLAALVLLAQAATPPARSAEMRVSVRVVRSVEVSVSREAMLRVRTSSGAVWSGPVDSAGGAPGTGVAPHAEDPGYVVVTILADAPPAPPGAAVDRPRS